MLPNNARTEPPRRTATPSASGAALNAQTVDVNACADAQNVFEVSFGQLRPSSVRFDRDRLTLAFEFDLNSNGDTTGTAQCIPDGAAHTLLLQATRSDAVCTTGNCGQPRPCQVHEAQNAREAVVSTQNSNNVNGTPVCTRPLPRRSQFLAGAGPAPAVQGASVTRAGAAYDNTNTVPATNSDNHEGNAEDDDDDDVPLSLVKKRMAARRASPAFEPIVKTEPVEKQCGRRLHPERRQFKIRSRSERVRWYSTQSAKPIDAVPGHLLKPNDGALYVHQYEKPYAGFQIWIYIKSVDTRAGASGSRRVLAGAGERENGDVNEQGGERKGGEWRRVQVGDPHPSLDGYVLHMLVEGEPRWVKPSSARQYASGKNKRARWAKSM